MSCSGGIATFTPTNYDEHILRARRFADAAAAAGTAGLNAAIAAIDWTDYVAAMHTDVVGWSQEMWSNLGKGQYTLYTDFRSPPATYCYPHGEAALYALLPIYQTFPAFYLAPSPSGVELTVQSSNNSIVTVSPTGDFRARRVLHAGWWGAFRWGQPNWATVALEFYACWEGVVPFASIQ
jgi:hypothetical protein